MIKYFNYLFLAILTAGPVFSHASLNCEQYVETKIEEVRSSVTFFRQNEGQMDSELTTYFKSTHQSRIALDANGIEVICSEKSVWGKVYLGKTMKQEFLERVHLEGLSSL
jgi:hypothetical protein